MKNISKLLILSFSFFLFTSFTHFPEDSVKLIKNKGTTFIYLFEDMNFSLNEISIEQRQKKQLFIILKYLRENPNLVIEISVHSSFNSTKDLSNIRAKVLKGFFVKYGINKNRIRAIGYNTSKYINKCLYIKKCTEKQQRANRRVQFKILNPEVLKNYIIVQK